LETPPATLAEALDCPGELGPGQGNPVLLVHGTWTNPEESWSWGYEKVLTEQGFDVCTVDLPGRAHIDMQVSVEYVVHAVREMAVRSKEAVDAIGHSQGGLLLRWAVKWWPDVQDSVDDLVMLAGIGHGTRMANLGCRFYPCFPAAWQYRIGANFITALNRGDETPGSVSYTSAYSEFDQAVRPPATNRLQGATNVAVQDRCPLRPVEHASLLGDAVAYQIAFDALTQPGPADLERMGAPPCTEATMEGADHAGIAVNLTKFFVLGFAIGTARPQPPASAEPPLREYAQ
jgi:triacylglycerol esterase/lipase EstA (alpha/beta hydrolase family)